MPKERSPVPTVPTDEQLTSHLKDAQANLKNCLAEYLPVRQTGQDDAQSIVTLYDKIRQEMSGDGASASYSVAKLSNYHRSKLKTAYNNALKSIPAETQRLRACLDELHEIKRIREEKRRLIFRKQQQNRPAAGAATASTNEGQQKTLTRSHTSPSSIAAVARTEGGLGGGGYGLRRGALMMLLQRAAAALPLWIGEDEDEGEEPPSLCGALPAAPDHICEPGDMVAVRAVVQSGDENWILAEVKNYDHSTGKYEVEDIDEEEKETYVISKKKLIPLPHYRAHPLLNPSALFEVNAVVWALYPQTTCFYKGVVERRPAGPNDPYLVAFEDSSYPSGYSLPLGVPQRYVIAQN